MGLRKKLTVVTAIFVVATGLVSSAVDFWLSAVDADKAAKDQINSTGKLYADHLSTWFQSKSRVLASFPVGVKDDQVLSWLKFTRDSGAFENVFLAFPNGDLLNANGDVLPPDNRDPRKWSWFQQAALRTDRVTVEMPSIASKTGLPVSSMAKGMVSQGHLEAVVGADVSISAIVNELHSARIVGDGFMMIVDKNGAIYADSDTSLLNQPATNMGQGLGSEDLLNAAQNGDIRTLTIKGEPSLVQVFEIPSSDYMLIAVSKRSVLLHPLYARLIRTLAVVACLLMGVLFASFLYINAQLKSLLIVRDAMKAIAQGNADLTRRIEVPSMDEVGETAAAFNDFVQHLAQLFDGIHSRTMAFTAGVKSLAVRVDQLAKDSDHLSTLSISSSGLIEQVAQGVSSIARAAREASGVTVANERTSGQSAEDMHKMSAQIEHTADSVRQSASKLNSLSERSREIMNVTSVIQGVADKTRLVALNANIEAARAGEAGRGFAVVANEIRTLAETTARATIEIDNTVKGIAAEVTQATQAMTTSVQRISESIEATDGASKRMKGMSDGMTSIKRMIESIADSTDQQEQAATSMARSTDSINERIASSNRDMQAAIQELKQLDQVAEEIRLSFSHFSTSEN